MSRPKANAIKVECAHDKMIPIADLKEHPGNPNKHPPEQIKLLAKIIRVSGWRNPIVVSNRSGLITKGHARLMAARALGEKLVPVDCQDYANEKDEIADMIADNRISELADLDRSMLRELAEQLDDGAFDMDLTGFDQAALEELMTATTPESDVDAEPQIDKAEELREKWGVKRGQVWELGAHRLMCGDALKDIHELINGAGIDATITDPPFSVNYDQSQKKRGGNSGVHSHYQEDHAVNILGFLRTIPSDVLVMTYPIDRHFFALSEILQITKMELRKELVWVKDSFSFWPGAKYQQRHEPILVCARKGVALNCDVPANQSTVFEFPRPKRHNLHPTARPTELWNLLCKYHVPKIAYDPFCGSGTTIIACEQLGRKCRAMEIDPGYVAVSIQRWADATGKTPKLL
jgi:DNA modification methylase